MRLGEKEHSQESLFCALLLLTGVLLYHILYFNSVLPELTGWGIYYAELLDRGQVPYRDFACYLPPFSLVTDWIFWKLSFGYVLVYRGWYLLERATLELLLYKLTIRWFQPRFAWLACLTGACLGAATNYDLCGDYNQTQTLFCVLLAYWTARFLEQEAGSRRRGTYMFLAGVQLALMVLLKQSLGFAAAVLCLPVLLVYCILTRDKRFGWYCAAAALGAAVPLVLTCGGLAVCGAWGPFLEQFFGTAGAKGGIGRILRSIRFLAERRSAALFLTGCLLAAAGKRAAVTGRRGWKAACCLLAAAFAVLLFLSHGSQLQAAWETTVEHPQLLLLWVFLLAFSIFLCWCHRTPSLQSWAEWNYALPVMFLFCLLLSLILVDPGGACSAFFEETGLFDSVFNQLVYLSRYALLGLAVLCVLPVGKDRRPPFPVPVLALALGSCIDVYSTNMASAGGMVYRELFLTAPVLLLLLFSYHLPRWNGLKNYALCLLCVLLCGLSMLQKYTGAYTWWCGTDYAWHLPARSEAVELKALAGFRLPKEKKREYEELTRIIQENGTEESTVWGFPHVKLFNILTDHYDLADPVPILFYDVCSDEMAEQEAAWLRQSPPDFVIWCDIPGCLETHEAYFRDGTPMGQREIIAWFAEAAPKEYVLVGQAESLFVYQRKGTLSVNYTYIQDPEAVNGTLGDP